MSLVTQYLDTAGGPSPAGRNVDVPPMLRKSNANKGSRIRFLFAALVVCIVTTVSAYAFITAFAHVTDKSKPIQTISIGNRQDLAGLAQPKVGGPAEANVNPEPAPRNIPGTESVKADHAKPVSVARLPEPEAVQPPPTADLTKEKALPQEPPKWARTEKTVAVKVEPKAVRAEPQHYFGLGVAAQKAKQYGPAMDYYRKTLSLDPSHPSALLNLATIHIHRGNQARAVQIFEKLQAAIPGNPGVVLNLGTLYIRQKKYEKAQQLIEGFIAVGGSHPDILFNLAYVNQVQSRPGKALEYYDQVLSLFPDHTKACLAAASVCEGQKQIEKALAYYNRALAAVDKQGPRSLKLKIESRIRLLRRIGVNLNRVPGEKI